MQFNIFYLWDKENGRFYNKRAVRPYSAGLVFISSGSEGSSFNSLWYGIQQAKLWISQEKKKSFLLFFLTMYCCSALWIFIQKGKYLLMLISLDFLGTIWTEYEHSKHRKSPLWTPMPFLQASDNLLSYLSHSFLWCVSSSGQSFWLDVMIFTPRWEKTFWCNFSSWSCATVSLCYSYIQHS